MSTYVCTICGYVYDEEKEGRWDDLPDDWKCPICGASRDAFERREDRPAPAPAAAPAAPAPPAAPDPDGGELKELSAIEMSVICSNLARGCEKQYLDRQAQGFATLAEFFRSKAAPAGDASVSRLVELVEADLASGFSAATAAASAAPDRGALRSLVWSEKVTRMLRSLLARYEREGERMLEGTGVFVCSVCGFTFVGDAPPELCPVCKVPAWKFDRVEGRA